MEPDLLCLGEPMVELNLPPDGACGMGVGGDVSNVAVAAARQGAASAVWTRLGADPLAARITDFWAGEGVRHEHVVHDRNASTGLYLVEHDAQGHRFGYVRKGSAASRMRPEETAALPVPRILHVSGISMAISQSACDTVLACAARMRAAGALVSVDPNLRTALWPLERARAVTHQAMANCDIALPGLDDARQLTGCDAPDAIVDFYLGLGCPIVALTLGAQGALIATAERRETIPAPKVDARDATGAGDCFDGCFLAELNRDDDPFGAGRYAVSAAALSTTGYGATAPVPRRAEVEAFMQASRS